ISISVRTTHLHNITRIHRTNPMKNRSYPLCQHVEHALLSQNSTKTAKTIWRLPCLNALDKENPLFCIFLLNILLVLKKYNIFVSEANVAAARGKGFYQSIKL